MLFRSWRDDLYWRIRGIEIELPRLADRAGDLRVLAQHFLNQARALVPGAGQPRLDSDTLRALEVYAWPGNLRELRHEMQRALIIAAGRDEILLDDLSPAVRGTPAPRDPGVEPPATLEAKLAALEIGRASCRERV